MNIYSDLKKKRVGPLLLVLYFVAIGCTSYLFRAVISSKQLSFPGLTSEILTLGIFFLAIQAIYRLIGVRSKGTMHIYWILALAPLVTYVTGGTVHGYRSSDEITITAIIALLVTGHMAYRSSSIHFKRKALALALTSAIIPILLFRRGYLDDSSFVLYGIYTTGTVETVSDILYVQAQYLNLVLLLIEITAASMIYLYASSKGLFVSLIKNIKPFRSMHFIMLVMIGVISVRRISPEHALDPLSPGHFPMVFIAVSCSAFLIWQFTSLINDLYDVSIDKIAHPERPMVGGDKNELYLELAITTAFISSWFTLHLGWFIFILNSIAIVAAVLYSMPPVRLRNRAYGHVCIGLGSVIAFLVGVYSPNGWSLGIPQLTRSVPFRPEVLQLSTLLFIVLSISPQINAISDYQGDLESGVKNVYTVYGFEKGKKIVTAMVVLLFMSPLIMFNEFRDMALMIPFAIISSIIFYRTERWRILFGFYFIILIYCMLRFLEFI